MIFLEELGNAIVNEYGIYSVHDAYQNNYMLPHCKKMIFLLSISIRI